MEQFLRIESVHREGRTRQYGYRLKQLHGLHRMLLENESQFLDALETDKKQDANTTQLVFRIILNVIATEATRLHKQYEKFHKQALSTVSTGSVLIIGDMTDPLGSIICPLTFVISSGSCAVLTPSDQASATRAILLSLFPKYIDREAFEVTDLPKLRLLECDFQIVVSTGGSFPVEPKKGRTSVESHVGINVLCHIDTTSPAAPDCAKALSYSQTLGDHPAAIDVLLILKSKIASLKAEMTSAPGSSPLEIREVNIEYLATAKKGAGPVLIGVSSTEEALLHLSKISVYRFTYFGDASYGSYMLQFLPAISSGSVNTYHASEIYSDLTAASFEGNRPVSFATRPSVTKGDEQLVTFPDFAIDYTRNTPFFVQGLIVSNYVAYCSVATVVAYIGWRFVKVLL